MIICGTRRSRSRFCCMHTSSGKSRTIATAGNWNRRAKTSDRSRAARFTFVASITVSRPALSLLAAMNRSTAKASAVAA